MGFIPRQFQESDMPGTKKALNLETYNVNYSFTNFSIFTLPQ